MPAEGPLVVEDDRFLRVVGIVLDPDSSRERAAAYADFFAHDEPDFTGYCQRVRTQVGELFPREVRLVETQDQLRAALPGSCALVVESLRVGRLQTNRFQCDCCSSVAIQCWSRRCLCLHPSQKQNRSRSSWCCRLLDPLSN